MEYVRVRKTDLARNTSQVDRKHQAEGIDP
jgi:hypothetical protein